MQEKERVTAISIRGSRAYVDAVNEMSKRKGKRTGDVIRELVDARYGDELKPYLSFFETSDHQSGHITE